MRNTPDLCYFYNVEEEQRRPRAPFVHVVKNKITITIAIAFLSLGVSKASIIPILDSVTPNGSGQFVFAYQADLQEDERLDPAATMGATCIAPGARVQCDPAGTFFTLYDVNGYVSSSAPANWYATAQFTGVTPSTIMGSTFDDPGTINVTFFYTGPVVHANGDVVKMPGFNIVSTSGSSMNGNFTSQATKDVGASAGDTDQTVGPVEVPAAGRGTEGSPVPEPQSATLLGGGFALLGVSLLLRRRVQRRSAD